MDKSMNQPDTNSILGEDIPDIEQLFAERYGHQTIAVGKTFGRYKIQGELGRGGMGVVYKVFDPKLNMTVALKVIMTEENPQSIERFTREAFATAKLDHPNIIRLYDVGDSPKPYFTMEYIEGQTLAYFIKERKIKPRQLVNIMIKVCDALAHAHKKKILHRDLKPSNIMLTTKGIPKIMDFGLAKMLEASQALSETGQILGTVHYMAPEQVDGKATYKSDIYSIGATIYEGITYNTIFQGDSHINLVYQILQQNPIPPRKINIDISPYLEAICLKCLHKKQHKRYNDFAELSRELKNFKANRPILAKKYTQWNVIKNFIKRHMLLCSFVFFAFIALIAFIGFRAKAYVKLEVEKNRVKKLNEKLVIEKQKTDKVNKDLTVLNQAIIRSFKYTQTTNNGKYFDLFRDKDFLDPVREAFRQSIRLQTAEEYQFIRALVLSQSEKVQDILQAVADYTSDIRKNPKEAATYNNRALAYQKLGKEKLAEIDFNRSIRFDPNNASTYNNRGFLYTQQNKTALAKQDYKKAIELNPTYAAAYTNRGILYDEMGNDEQAEKNYSKAIKLDAKFAQAYMRRGILYADVGKYNLAIADWQKAISLGESKTELQANIDEVKKLLTDKEK